MTTTRATPLVDRLEPLDVSVLRADGHVWVSAQGAQGSVFGVPRRFPHWDLPAGASTPETWMADAVGFDREDADRRARGVGTALTEVVFGVPEIATLLHRTRGIAAAAGRQVLVRVLAAPQEVASWPWETMLDPEQPERFLTLARDVHVVRAGRSRTYPVRRSWIEPPLDLLLVMSSPLPDGRTSSETPFDLYEEKRALLSELAPLVERGLLRVDVEDRPTMERLRSRLGGRRGGYHVIHYLGHARPEGLRLEGRDGRGRLTSSVDFAMLLQQLPDLRLAVFAGCETARAPVGELRTDLWPGALSTADLCVRDACPMVVGMQAVLPFGVERIFTRYFYQALTGGQSVVESLRLARLAIAGDELAVARAVNWAVPTLFVGGTEPGPLVDPEATASPPSRRRRVSMRFGIRQGELRFISRLTELRQAVDVLAGRNEKRVLQVLGPPRTGRTSFVDRALEELDDDVPQLFVDARRLLDSGAPVRELASLVHEVIRTSGRRATPERTLAPAAWWERLVGDLSDVPLALAIDDVDLMASDPGGAEVLEALRTLVTRRTRARLAVSARDEVGALTDVAPERTHPIRLRALGWRDIWQWVRRNLPLLARYPESELSGFYANLPRLEQWEQLADALAAQPAPVTSDLPAVVERISGRMSVPSSPSPTGNGAGVPLFGTGRAPAELSDDVPDEAVSSLTGPLRIAVAGPFTENRQEEFARGVTQLAAEHDVAGRVVGGDVDHSSSLAELLTLESPFDASGRSTDAALLSWLERAAHRAADIVLCDFGGPQSGVWDPLLATFDEQNRLVVAAGGNTPEEHYPAWSSHVLAVGALGSDGLPASYSMPLPTGGKPELWAAESVDGTALAAAVTQRGLRGTSFAALNAVAAATLVWATDRGMRAQDVRDVLVSSARATTVDGGIVRVLDTTAALRRTREQLLRDALERGALGLGELLTTSGVGPEIAVPLLDGMVERDELRVVHGSEGGDLYENPDAVYLAYARLRELPRGPARTVQLEALVGRARALALRGRYSRDEVERLFASGHDGRRVVALAAVQARPDLGAATWVAKGIAETRSSFEQYQALRSAQELVPRLDHADRCVLDAALDGLLDGTADAVDPDTSRYTLALALRESLRAREADQGDPPR